MGCDQGRRCVAAHRRPALAKRLSTLYVAHATRFTVAPFAVQPLYHTALGSNLCSLTEIAARRFAKSGARLPPASSGVRKRTLYPVNEQRAAGQLIYTSFFFGDVLVTQISELCRERVFVSEASQIEYAR